MKPKEKNSAPKIKLVSIIGVIIVLALGVIVINHIVGNIYKVLSGFDQDILRASETADLAPLNIPEEMPLAADNNIEEELPPHVAPVFQRIDMPDIDAVEAYLVTRQEFAKVQNMDDFIVFVETYGSEKNIASIQAMARMQDIISWRDMEPLIAPYFAREVKSTEIISASANIVTLKIIFEDGREGEAIMVRERGGWRLDEEK